METNDICDFICEINYIKEEFEINIEDVENYRNIYLENLKFQLENLDKHPSTVNKFNQLVKNITIGDVFELGENFSLKIHKSAEIEEDTTSDDINDINDLGEDFLQVMDDYSLDIEKITSIAKEITSKCKGFKRVKGNRTCLFILMTSSAFLKQKYNYDKMFLINLYTILDEYLSDIIKSVVRYDNKYLDGEKLTISYKEVKEFNDDHIKEHFVNSMIRNNLSGIFQKIKRLFKYLDIKQTKLQIFNDIRLFNEDRNMLVHNRGIYNKKAIEHIGKSNGEKLNISEGKKVELSHKKIEIYIKISKDIIKFLCNKINEKYEFEKVQF